VGIANDTDALANASFARRRAFAGYTMVETPERRDFFYGNTLVLDREPDPAEHAAWVRRHAAHFAGTGVKRHAIVWERDGVSESPASPGPGVDGVLERSIVFVRRTPFEAVANDFDIRLLDGDTEWALAAELDDAETDPADAALADFARWRFDRLRDAGRAGSLRMWGLWSDGRLRAFAGIHANADLARFATPVTAPEFRRRGAFRALCAAAVNDTLRRNPRVPIVIRAAAGSDPAIIYPKLGFEAVGEQVGLLAATSGPAP
jgi:hypothetical protein